MPLSRLVLPWLYRKLTSAAISAVLTSVYLAVAMLYNAGSDLGVKPLLSMIMIVLLYVTPMMYIYGVASSMISELLLYRLLRRKWLHGPLSAALHMFFGYWGQLLLLGFFSYKSGILGMQCALLYFLIDLILSKFLTNAALSRAIQAFIFLPLLLFFISIIGINL
ncbi:hypothetical protein [Paenibacillus sp. R14(2021)]|uniref:hypothetical protein n=1 Tax=Paenibacillus sp. R14(2021) TaxID=2859228 RepID=UPI001C616689|nr:hypothetical protein [Paenibacillus sp. R14(2021)]